MSTIKLEDDKSLLYALRCVAASPSDPGISQRVLDGLVEDDLISGARRLTSKGESLLIKLGGPFPYAESLDDDDDGGDF